MEELFTLCVGTFEKLMRRDEHTPKVTETPVQEVVNVAPSAEMEIVDVESK